MKRTIANARRRFKHGGFLALLYITSASSTGTTANPTSGTVNSDLPPPASSSSSSRRKPSSSLLSLSSSSPSPIYAVLFALLVLCFVFYFLGVPFSPYPFSHGFRRNNIGRFQAAPDDETVSHLYDDDLINATRHKWGRRFVDGALSGELWEKIKDDVAIGVKTGHEVAKSRLDKLRSTGWWSTGRDIPNLLFISDHSDKELGVVSIRDYGLALLNATAFSTSSNINNSTSDRETIDDNPNILPEKWFQKSGWRGDKDKNLPAFHLLRSVFPKKKWYILLDDDTYILLENFAHYVSQPGMQPDSRPIYTGKVFYISRCGGFARDGTNITNKSDRGMFAHGGSGIVMNKLAMDVMYPNIAQCVREYSSCWAGDMQVGLCLRKHGVKVRRYTTRRVLERNFIPFRPSKAMADRRYSQRWKSDHELPLTFHKIPEAEQAALAEFEKISMRSKKMVAFQPLRLYLTERGIIPAHATNDRKSRFFSTEFLPKRLLVEENILERDE